MELLRIIAAVIQAESGADGGAPLTRDRSSRGAPGTVSAEARGPYRGWPSADTPVRASADRALSLPTSCGNRLTESAPRFTGTRSGGW